MSHYRMNRSQSHQNRLMMRILRALSAAVRAARVEVPPLYQLANLFA